MNSAQVTKPEKPPIYVDATYALLNFVDPPSGIPRVEKFIFLSALEDSDARVKIVRFHPKRGAYREIESWEKQSLVFKEVDFSTALTRRSFWSDFRTVLRRIRLNPLLGRSSDRYYARLLSWKHKSKNFFNGLKLILRGYRLYRRFLNRSLSSAPDLDPRQGILLLSDGVLTGAQLPEVVAASRRRAFICHDLIPILNPGFLDKPGRAKRFAENIDLILEAPGTTVVCTSETSRAMVDSYLGDTGSPGLKRFSMPSILFEEARKLGRTARMEPEEPYVLFCATVEKRKNHILLAQVWKRALDEGVRLPKLVCAGRWGWGNEELGDYLKRHPALSSRILFTGQLSDLELMDFYRGALFGVMPSFLEGWGLGASECLDFGVPVIISTAPALQEATHGLMPSLDPNDTEAWFGEIRKLAEDPNYRALLLEKITQTHRPISTKDSWESIKSSLWEA